MIDRTKPPLCCPECGHPVSRVIDSRDTPRGFHYLRLWSGGWWRIRRCQKCFARFTTEEHVSPGPPPPPSSSFFGKM